MGGGCDVNNADASGAADDDANCYFGLMYAFFVSLFVLVIGGGAFLYSATFIVHDQERCKLMSNVETSGISSNRGAGDDGEQPLLDPTANTDHNSANVNLYRRHVV